MDTSNLYMFPQDFVLYVTNQTKRLVQPAATASPMAFMILKISRYNLAAAAAEATASFDLSGFSSWVAHIYSRAAVIFSFPAQLLIALLVDPSQLLLLLQLPIFPPDSLLASPPQHHNFLGDKILTWRATKHCRSCSMCSTVAAIAIGILYKTLTVACNRPRAICCIFGLQKMVTFQLGVNSVLCPTGSFQPDRPAAKIFFCIFSAYYI